MEVVGADPVGSQWRRAGWAAVVSVVTMPLTAVWFLALGGLMLTASAAVAAVRRSPDLGSGGYVGLGLLVGPFIYLGLAVLN